MKRAKNKGKRKPLPIKILDFVSQFLIAFGVVESIVARSITPFIVFYSIAVLVGIANHLTENRLSGKAFTTAEAVGVFSVALCAEAILLFIIGIVSLSATTFLFGVGMIFAAAMVSKHKPTRKSGATKKGGPLLSWLNPLEMRGILAISIIQIVFISALIGMSNISFLTASSISLIILVLQTYAGS
jgi:hypothetical protein